MKEKIITFGKNNNLIGIISADGKAGQDDKPAVLILNSGLVHRPGPFRMNVELAREIAKLGYNVLRFDISGIGDSDKAPNDGREYEKRNVEDVGEAVKYLSRTNGYGIVIIGLCTGAELGHRSVVAYEEIVASILLDGIGYPTMKFYWKRYAPVLLSFNRIVNFLTRTIRSILHINNGLTAEAGVEAYYWKLPQKSKYISDLKVLKKRCVKQYYLYTGDVDEYYNYKEQFFDGFSRLGLADNVDVEFYEKSDHTYYLRNDRNKMVDDVKKWLKTNI